MSETDNTRLSGSGDTELPGKTIGNYKIVSEIGRGGMATVYSAVQLSMNRKVAIKVLPRYLFHDPGFLERFKREVDVISKLEHPHILPIFDYGEADGLPFIAMRYLGGGSMADMIRRGEIPDLADLEKPLMQVAEALHYAHQQGIIHRDLKPGNIMLDENNNAYLSDFGIARVMDSNLTGSAIIGTPAYMSPEQANGQAIDGRADIYSLGIVLFELITGREPYRAETPVGLLLMHLNEPMPPISQFRDGVPEAIQAVVSRATAKDPNARFASAGEMSAAYRAALSSTAPTRPAASAHDPQRTVAPQVIGNAGDTTLGQTAAQISGVARAPHTESQPQPAEKAAGGRRLLPLMLVGLLVVLVLGVGGAAVTGLLPLGPSEPVVPTPFRGATTVSEEDVYSISVPSEWIFTDNSSVTRLLHLWKAPEGEAFASVSLFDNRVAPDDFFPDYLARFSFISEATAEDGTLRRSYRVNDDTVLPNGQIDLFFFQREDETAVLELFSADGVATDPAMLTTLQLLLDSFRWS